MTIKSSINHNQRLQSFLESEVHLGSLTCSPSIRPYLLGTSSKNNGLSSNNLNIENINSNLFDQETKETIRLNKNNNPESLKVIQEILKSKYNQTNWINGYFINPDESLKHWLNLLIMVDERIKNKEPILIVSTNPTYSRLAKGVRAPFLEHQSKVKTANAPITLLTMNWIYGRLTNFNLLREMAMKYQVTPSYERKYADHIRYSIYIRPLESRRIGGKLPGLIIFINTSDHLVAVRETHSVGIPCAGVVNTDFPSVEMLNYPLPGNDQSIRSHLRYLHLRSNQFEKSFNS